MKVIYDLGANNGDDIPYYLIKADRVVAVEANPVLANQIKNTYAADIESGRLIVENCVVSAEASADSVSFYINQNNHVQSTFVKPTPFPHERWKEIKVSAKNVVEIIRQHGDPYYVKIDIEYYDQYILKALFDANIRPEYISSEAHTVEIFCILAGHGNYNRFKVVLGGQVASDYSNKQVEALDGSKYILTCPHHSAGPFGEDVNGNWKTTGEFFESLKTNVKFGWIDIHATTHKNS